MRRGKDAARLASPAPDYPAELPRLRRLVIVIDMDTGKPIARTIALYRTPRVDCYRAEVSGRVWQRRIGWSRVLEGLRKALPRSSAGS